MEKDIRKLFELNIPVDISKIDNNSPTTIIHGWVVDTQLYIEYCELKQKWDLKTCKRCLKRNCVSYNVDEDIWLQVTKGNFPVLCITCFDELAEENNIPYTLKQIYHVSWSEWNEDDCDQFVDREKILNTNSCSGNGWYRCKECAHKIHNVNYPQD